MRKKKGLDIEAHNFQGVPGLHGPYKPSPRIAGILNEAMALIKSVPYAVPGRWVFYQIVQRYGLPKSDYKNFKSWTSCFGGD